MYRLLPWLNKREFDSAGPANYKRNTSIFLIHDIQYLL